MMASQKEVPNPREVVPGNVVMVAAGVAEAAGAEAVGELP
jgi:hypothetical protein